MDRNGNGNRCTRFDRADTRHKGRNALGEVMNRDGQRCEQTHTVQSVVVARVIFELLDRVQFVRVFGLGHSAVDKVGDEHTPKECGSCNQCALLLATHSLQLDTGRVEHLHKRYVDHHARRKTQREGQKTTIGALGEEGDDATDTRCQTRCQRD